MLLMTQNISPKEYFKQILTHPSFFKSLYEIKEKKINIDFSSNIVQNGEYGEFPSADGIVTLLDEDLKVDLNPSKGAELVHDTFLLAAYDESIEKYDAIEGSAYLTAHSIIYLDNNEYLPIIKLDFGFYTCSSKISEGTEYIQKTDNIELTRSQDYVKFRDEFIKEIVPKFPNNTIFLIDGPLIGGNINYYTTKLNEYLLNQNIIPIFIVKNSNSNLVTDYLIEYRNKFNSDMHWSYELLSKGQRTGFFCYQNKIKEEWGKIFTYVKSFDNSPQRIEFHTMTYKKYGKTQMKEILDVIYYLYLVQGNLKNPQVRPVVIAEQYAREAIKIINFKTMMKRIGLISTMNEERFG